MALTEIIGTAYKLIDTMDSLTAVLNDETSNVYNRKSEDLARIYNEKTRLLAEYASHVDALSKIGDRKPIDLPAEVNDAIKSRSLTLGDAMERNMLRLRAAQAASQKVVDIIIDSVKKQRITGAAYGKDIHGGLIVNAGGETGGVTLDTRL